MNKIKDIINGIKHISIDARGIKYMEYVILISLLPVILYLGLWTWCAVGHATPLAIQLLSELRSFVSVITSTTFVAAVLAYGRGLVDNNNDNIPDDWENKKEGKQ